MLAEPATGALPLSAGVVIALAAIALLGVAIYLRRLHRDDELRSVNGAAGIISATGILVSALVISTALGNVGMASADKEGVSALPTQPGLIADTDTNTDTDTLQLPTLAD